MYINRHTFVNCFYHLQIFKHIKFNTVNYYLCYNTIRFITFQCFLTVCNTTVQITHNTQDTTIVGHQIY